MKKFGVRLLCCFIPSPRMRHWVHHKMLGGKNAVDWDTNHIWLIAPDGSRRSVRSLPNCEFVFNGKNNNIYLYEPLHDVRLSVYVFNDTNITIHSGGQMQLQIHRAPWGCRGTANLVIGPDFKTSGLVIIELCNSDVTIGRDCLFARDIVIRSGDYHTVIDNTTRCVLNYDKDIKIGNHVWVATGVHIGKGAVIPDNSIVGVRSLVTHQFDESNVVIAGVPAKVVKRNIDWDIHSIPDYEATLHQAN